MFKGGLTFLQGSARNMKLTPPQASLPTFNLNQVDNEVDRPAKSEDLDCKGHTDSL